MIVPADQYFITRPPQSGYAGYYSETRDPDGRLRDRVSDPQEREQHLSDIAAELAFVKLLSPDVLLDVGCGLGWFLEASDARCKVGVEICLEAINYARSRGLYVKDSMLGFADGAFDAVRCHHVIEHMSNPRLELQEMHRVLKPGGWLLMSTPDFGSPCALRFGERFRMLHDATHCSLFTNESMHRFLRDHGFEIEHVEYPFPNRYAKASTMWHWADLEDTGGNKWSPPWPGNWMSFYARKC